MVADRAEGRAAEDLRRELVEDDRRRAARRRRRTARPASRARRARRGRAGATVRRRRCARPSRLTSVPSRSRLLVPGSTRSAQPTASPWNIVTAITASARSASARTAGSAAASSPETIRRPIGCGSVARRRRRRRPTPRRRRGRSASRAGRRRRSRHGRAVRARSRARRRGPALAVRARPDQDRALGRAHLGSRAARRARAPATSSTRAPLRRAALSQRSTIGARSSTESPPTTTTICGVADRRERQPERIERVRDLLGEDGVVRAEPAADAVARARRPASTVSVPDSAVTMCVARRAQQPLGVVERVVPRDLLEPARPAAQRLGDPVVRVEVRDSRSGPCRRASPRRSRDGSARGRA